jgi:SAM-dependent methyltransferase
MPIRRGFRRLKARVWQLRGRVPHAYGYNAARWLAIERDVKSRDGRYGRDGGGFDERAVEYPWVFHRLSALELSHERVLDAGSVMNYPRVLQWWRDARYPPLSIVTQAYEGHANVSSEIRYEFADLRLLPYRDEWFSAVLCLSTIEHVGLDNTFYGAAAEASSDPGADALRAMEELRRVTTRRGRLLLSVPFGARSNRGWFRIFDEADLNRLVAAPGWTDTRARFFQATRDGWRECSATDARTAGYNELSRGLERQTAPAWVAGAEAVALVEMTRA